MQHQSQLVPELERLQQLHTSGFLTDTELAQAKAKLLGTSAASAASAVTVGEADAMLERVDRAERRAGIAELQSELFLLDQDWEQECARFVYRNRYGQTTEPNRWSAILAGLLTMAIGIYQLMQASGPAPTALVGILFLTIGPVLAFAAWGNAIGFERRKKRYRERRLCLQEKIAETSRRK